MELEKLQASLDDDKWYESQKKQRDVCGEFPYCVKCDKDKRFPCANAYTQFYAKTETVKAPAVRDTAKKETGAKRRAK